MASLARPSSDQIVLLYYILISIGLLMLLAIFLKIVVAIYETILKKKNINIIKYQMGLRMKMANKYAKVSPFVEAIAGLLCITSCCVFIYLAIQVSAISPKASEEGYDVNEFHKIFRQHWVIVLEFVISLFSGVDFFLHFLLAVSKFRFIFSIFPFIDVVTAIPGLVGIFVGEYYYGFQFLRFIRLFKTMSFFRPHMGEIIGASLAHMFILILSIVSLVFSAAGFIFVAENNTVYENGLVTSMVDAFYFVIVSLTTVGYGDISPKSATGKIVVMCMLATAVAIVPVAADKLSRTIKERRSRGNMWYHGPNHVVLVSETGDPVLPFLKEFFHPDRKYEEMNVCLLLEEEELARQTDLFVKKPFFEVRVTHLHGQAMISNDLRRAKIERAEAVFVFSSKHATAGEDDDAKTILNAYSIRRSNATLPMYVQIVSNKHKQAVQAIGAQVVLSLNELRMGMIAQSCICPGFSTLIGNMIRSFQPPKNTSTYTPWELEYIYGAGFEVYVINNMHPFHGMRYTDVTKILYERFGVLLFALGNNQKSVTVDITTDGYSRNSTNRDSITPKENSEDFVLHELGKTSSYRNLIQDRSVIELNPGKSVKVDEKFFGVILAQDEGVIPEIENFDITAYLSAHPLDLDYDKPKFPACLKATIFKRGELDTTKASPTPPPVAGKKRSKGTKLEDATIDSVYDVNVVDHVVVIGTFSDIVAFVTKMRNYRLKKILPIVILSPTLPAKFEWRALAHYQQIYFVQGLPTEIADLERAGAFQAHDVIILGESGDQTDIAIDSKSIMVFQLLKQSKSFTILDLAHASNAKFMGSAQNSQRKLQSEWENPYYASGHVYASSCLDTLLVQSYFNPVMDQVVDKMLNGSVFPMKISQYFPDCIGKPFIEVFKGLLECDLVPLGLYRPPYNEQHSNNLAEKRETRRGYGGILHLRNNKKASIESKLGYVVTNPPPTTIVSAGDQVVVLYSRRKEKKLALMKSLSQMKERKESRTEVKDDSILITLGEEGVKDNDFQKDTDHKEPEGESSDDEYGVISEEEVLDSVLMDENVEDEYGNNGVVG